MSWRNFIVLTFRCSIPILSGGGDGDGDLVDEIADVGFLDRYQARLAARPLLTQSIATSVLFATGDITAQQFVDKKGTKHDFVRTARMALYGGGV
jgi:hypothetical protein